MNPFDKSMVQWLFQDGHETKSLIQHDGMVKGRFSGDDNDDDCDFCSQNQMGVRKKVQNQLVGCLVTILTEIRWLCRSLKHTCSKDLFRYFGSGAWDIPHWPSGTMFP